MIDREKLTAAVGAVQVLVAGAAPRSEIILHLIRHHGARYEQYDEMPAGYALDAAGVRSVCTDGPVQLVAEWLAKANVALETAQ